MTAAVGPGAVGLQRRCESGVDVGVVVDVVAEEAALRLPDRVPPAMQSRHASSLHDLCSPLVRVRPRAGRRMNEW